MTRKGKIARMGAGVRDEVNRRLHDGEPGKKVIEWLNGLAEVRAVLAREFGGRPISKQNFSEWKVGGYRDWLAQKEIMAQADGLRSEAKEIERVAEGRLTDDLGTALAARYAGVMMSWDAGVTTEMLRDLRTMSGLCRDIGSLRRADYDRGRLELERERVDWEREKLMIEDRGWRMAKTEGRTGNRKSDDEKEAEAAPVKPSQAKSGLTIIFGGKKGAQMSIEPRTTTRTITSRILGWGAALTKAGVFCYDGTGFKGQFAGANYNMSDGFADKIAMQHRLFAELSDMFGREVPLYDKSLLVNKACNQTVCALLGQLHTGFSLSDRQLDKTGGERHGAIRIGKPSEYRWVAGFFAAFGLEPHNYYDMTKVGNKSQPIVATAFRSSLNPEHRVFCSLLMTDYFDPAIRERIEKLLQPREVFSPRAQELILKNQKQGGLNPAEAEELIREGVTRIFKWTGKANDHQLYQDLCKEGFKIAADIACFESHHLNHLTPNTFCMDLYTGAMKFCLGEMDAAAHLRWSERILTRLQQRADKDYMKLHFKHLSAEAIDAFGSGTVAAGATGDLAAKLTKRLQEADLDMSKLKHSGFKDFTEGPPENTPILLRQDSYKALTEPVAFQQPDGSKVNTVHTARFGEIEQRFYATTTKGRELYDKCLAAAEVVREKNAALIKQDYDAYLKAYADCFAEFPKTLPELLAQKLVYGRFSVTEKGLAVKASGSIKTTEIIELTKLGQVRYEGLRYEDFLPVSAAGIFASNLGQYGTKSTATEKPSYSKKMLEDIMGKKIIDSDVIYRGLEAESVKEVYVQLGLWETLVQAGKDNLERAIASKQSVRAK